MGGFGFGEILMIVGIILLLFGAKKIPELMRGVGKGVREFNDAKSSTTNNREDINKNSSPPPTSDHTT